MRAATASFLILLFSVPQGLLAQTHVVSPAELQTAAVAASRARQQNIETIQQFLSSEKALQTAHVDPHKVSQAVSQLDTRNWLNLPLGPARRRQISPRDISATAI